MDQYINRVGEEMARWNKREEHFTRLFPDSISRNRPFLLEKLAHLERINVRYKQSVNPDERLTLRMLNEHKRSLERQLYPNRLYRLIRRLIVPKVMRQQEQKQAQQNAEHLQQLKGVLKIAGFAQLIDKAEQLALQGTNHIVLPMSRYENERERMDYQVSIKKDQSGAYYLEGYKAGLYSEEKKAVVASHYFKQDQSLVPTDLSYNLLSGRAIKSNASWVQFDLNDKDADGNYRIKEFPGEYGYKLREAVLQLPVGKGLGEEYMSKLLGDLEKGRKVDVTVTNGDTDRKLKIEANPQFRTVNVFDELGKKMSIEAAKSTPKQTVIKQLKPEVKKELPELKKGIRR